MNAGTLSRQALLNCLIREVSGPEEQAWEDDGHLMIRLARSGRLLRARLRRPSAGLSPRLTGQVQLRAGGQWQPVSRQRLTGLIAGELGLATGLRNDEFAGQVESSHAALAAILRARATPPGPAPGADDVIGRYLDSEQALVAGHRFHPAPKARDGRPRDWLAYAPEARARFPLRFLGVRDDAAAGDGDTAGLDGLGGPAAPVGYRVLPAHPWQLQLLSGRPSRKAFRDGRLADLGAGTREVAATSLVRTVYDPAADVFCKFSLNVRITNCVRTSAWYELVGSVALTRLLAPVARDLAARFPGTVLLTEPGYRTVSLGCKEAFEGLAVIARDGLRARLAAGVTPLLAAALAEPPLSDSGASLLDGRDPGWLAGWWESYVRIVAGPVLDAYFRHGVVLEPHLQNVLVGVDGDGLPVQAILRDLEGVKLAAPRHDALLAALTPGVARALSYDPARGWSRVAYCLLVNHLAEIAAALADRCPGREEQAEAGLWARARQVLAGIARDHGWPPELRAVLAGVPLPAKANLTVRWRRAADRDAGYVPVPSPLGEQALARGREMTRTC